MVGRIWKPWFVYRPGQLVRRAAAGLRPPRPGYAPLPTSWGVPVLADPTREIGRCIRTTGVYDLAVSEALARLVSAGDTVIDAGANVGYMTVLAGTAAGPAGTVLSFEPHPELFPVLERNAAAARERVPFARTVLRAAALGDRPGTVELQIPTGFEGNDGIARVGPAGPAARTVTVPAATLDDALGDGSAAVLKLDVEGYEPTVLAGAGRALAGKRIRHVVFEDHDVADSAAVRALRDAGYEVFALGWGMGGPRVEPLVRGKLARRYEAANFIATADPADLTARCRPRGWRVLSGRLAARAG